MTTPRPTSARLRETILDTHFLPIAKHVFAKEPRANSLIFAVAQFWADEADDAVHSEIVISSAVNPTWPECYSHEHNAFASEGEDSYDALEGQWQILSAATDQLPADRRFTDSNGEMIPAFAAFTKEECTQEDDPAEAFLPYAIARRSGGDVAIEIVGKMLRPEWEDNWDVGFYKDDEEDESPPDRAVETAAAPRPEPTVRRRS